ncbi:MAG: DUF3332 domain-containing protein [Bacteroidaceae bacterium]|nr:DUF3332 domain-containing protein [Bacteroidaceae bacterium]
MKKIKTSIVAAMLCGSMLFTSCVGSFSLFNKLLDWNNGIGSKFVNELVFIALNFIPVYEVATMVDVIVLNSIEFWSGDRIVENETKTVKGSDGEEYLVERSQNGYEITKGDETVSLIFDSENNSWSWSDGETTAEMIRFNENGTATMANGKTVQVNAAGVMNARQSADYGYLANR